MTQPPIQLSIPVPLSQKDAFLLFTERIHEWWPLEAFAVSGPDVATCLVDSGEGLIYERTRAGDQHIWAEIVAWDPPHRLVVSWHPGGGPPTQLEVTFTPSEEGTLVELEHRGWEVFGDLAEQARGEYSQGWAMVVGQRFAAAAGATSA